ncbi:DinB family protein [Rhizosphaericola mali]|uniref:DinB family protein n=1 Tax=Rhizosphaericola mali TaxID=2545455 RepID=A0A5P2G4M8_9BACT|nr:DinB family protein [Rhizosphaericola mali]QES88720.1 DinB family protein [Rhizosphaericola mali]
MMNSKLNKELELIRYVRNSVTKLIENLSLEELNVIPEHMNNNLIWNLGHMVFTQQMLCYKLGGLEPTIDVGFFAQFAPDTKPKRLISAEEIIKIKTAFHEAFEQLASDVQSCKLEAYQGWSLPSGITIDNFEDAMITNAIHEGRHFGVVISLVKWNRR